METFKEKLEEYKANRELIIAKIKEQANDPNVIENYKKQAKQLCLVDFYEIQENYNTAPDIRYNTICLLTKQNVEAVKLVNEYLTKNRITHNKDDLTKLIELAEKAEFIWDAILLKKHSFLSFEEIKDYTETLANDYREIRTIQAALAPSTVSTNPVILYGHDERFFLYYNLKRDGNTEEEVWKEVNSRMPWYQVAQ
jgi:hypothetical protein